MNRRELLLVPFSHITISLLVKRLVGEKTLLNLSLGGWVVGRGEGREGEGREGKGRKMRGKGRRGRMRGKGRRMRGDGRGGKEM